MKALQFFSDEALERGKAMSIEERLRFLDEFRRLYAEKAIEDSPDLAPAKLTASESRKAPPGCDRDS